MSGGPHCLSDPAVQCPHLSTGLSLSLTAFLLDIVGHIQLQGRFLPKVLNSYTTQSPFVIFSMRRDTPFTGQGCG